MQAINVIFTDQFKNLTVYQRGVYYAGLKLYKKHSLKINCLSTDSKQFKLVFVLTSVMKTLALTDKFCLLLKVLQCSGKQCNLKTVTAIFAEMLENLKKLMQFIPQGCSYNLY
jgi:hypothetical protein